MTKMNGFPQMLPNWIFLRAHVYLYKPLVTYVGISSLLKQHFAQSQSNISWGEAETGWKHAFGVSAHLGEQLFINNVVCGSTPGSYWHVKMSLDKTLKACSDAIVHVQLSNNNFPVRVSKKQRPWQNKLTNCKFVIFWYAKQ